MNIERKKLTVAEYLTQQIDLCGKSQREIATEIGYENANIITMFKQGHTKIPLNQVGPLATALGINPANFMRMVLEEYMPETWEAVECALGCMILSEEEARIVLTFREMRLSDADSFTVAA